MVSRKDIADIIFPDVTETIQDLEKKYPPRNNPICSRIAPSPTGFMHIGNFFQGLVARKFAKQNGGTFFVRIEDTDQKREVEGATELVITILRHFDITIDEGPIGENSKEIGEYGPYVQSNRKYIYNIFAKYLLENGLAYPCWMTTEELEIIRDQQTKSKVTPGIYGNYSVRRNKSPEEIMEKLQSDKNFVIRFRSPGEINKRIVFEDTIKGRIETIDNCNDIILIKSDELPTYHLAHIADDHLMRTSHIIRSEEWLASVPLHIQLFTAFGLPYPKYCHIAPLCKIDEEDGNKRKLSKRKDPEANVDYFFESGYATQGIIEYLTNIIDPGFEDRQKANPEKSYLDFEIHLDKMGKSGALFDLVKLQSVNNNYLSRISTDQLYDQSLARALKYRPELAKLMQSDIDYTKAAMNIERHTAKDPKRFTTYADVETQLRFFFDDERTKLHGNIETLKDGNVIADKFLMQKFVDEYSQAMNLSMTVEEWFAQLKEIGKKYGFAENNAQFKEGGYIGKTGDLAMFLRIQLCCATQTPDLYSVMQVMGKERVVKRLQNM